MRQARGFQALGPRDLRAIRNGLELRLGRRSSKLAAPELGIPYRVLCRLRAPPRVEMCVREAHLLTVARAVLGPEASIDALLAQRGRAAPWARSRRVVDVRRA